MVHRQTVGERPEAAARARLVRRVRVPEAVTLAAAGGLLLAIAVPAGAATPDPITGLSAKAVTSTRISLSWTNPHDATYAGVAIRRATGKTPPRGPRAGRAIAVVERPADNYTDRTVDPATTYSYALFAIDDHGNFSPPVSATVSTPGDSDEPGSAWGAADAHGAIEGYADRTSVLSGQDVHLYVSTHARHYVVRAFRMGWYRGRHGRQVWQSPRLTGQLQSGPVVTNPATNTMSAPWRRSLTVSTSGWTPGDYLFRLDTGTGKSSYVPLVVRTSSALDRIVLVSAVTTWQAYNLWGCCDLYNGADGSFASRARVVTFDRPYLNGNGAGQFVRNELPIVAEAERLELRLDYVTDVDLHAYPHLLDGAAAVVSMGHDEYYSPEMRTALTTARARGANLAFFGANAIYRRIRFASTAHGPDRLEINYKVASEDPLYGTDNPDVTADWPAAPDARPESSLIGAQYACNLGTLREPGVVVAPHNWVFAGTNAQNGLQLPGLIGSETDAVQLAYPTPQPIKILMHSPTPCPGGGPGHADATYYIAESGAGVFDAGSIGWSCAYAGCASSARTARVVQRATDNVLSAFAQKRAGRRFGLA